MLVVRITLVPYLNPSYPMISISYPFIPQFFNYMLVRLVFNSQLHSSKKMCCYHMEEIHVHLELLCSLNLQGWQEVAIYWLMNFINWEYYSINHFVIFVYLNIISLYLIFLKLFFGFGQHFFTYEGCSKMGYFTTIVLNFVNF